MASSAEQGGEREPDNIPLVEWRVATLSKGVASGVVYNIIAVIRDILKCHQHQLGCIFLPHSLTWSALEPFACTRLSEEALSPSKNCQLVQPGAGVIREPVSRICPGCAVSDDNACHRDHGPECECIASGTSGHVVVCAGCVVMER